MLILARLILPKGEDGFPAAPQAARNAGAAGGALRTQSAPSSKLARSGPAQEGGPRSHRDVSDRERPKNAVARGALRPRKGPRLKCVGFILDHADTPAFCLFLNRGFVAEMSCVLDPSQGTPHLLMYDPPSTKIVRRSKPRSPALGGVPSCNHLAGSHSGHSRSPSTAPGAAPGRPRPRR